MPKFDFSLTGTPDASQWPPDLSVPLESFPYRPPKRPVDLCPHLDEYANDLLTVRALILKCAFIA